MLIKIGDVVDTTWGIAKVVGIEEVRPNEKYGHDCLEANIGSRCDDRRFKYVVDLDNGHWCRASQIVGMVNEEKIKY
tara:strand:+ start:516 stop:746 length:231 start_codon:yes stop_codon:yes gene_type:complete